MPEEFEDNAEDTNEVPAGDTPSWMSAPNAEYDALVAPTARIRFLTTNGTFDVAVEDGQPMILQDALTKTGLRYNNASVFQLDGANIGMDTVLQPGATVVAINSVKGGGRI